MATLTVTNIGTSELWLRDLYTSLAPGQTKTCNRTPAELGDMRGLQQFVDSGVVEVSVTLAAYEVVSELVSVWPLGLNWRPTVASLVALNALPTAKNRLGDIRLVTATLEPYAWNGTAWIGLRSPTGPAGGDLSGNYPNPAVAGLQGRPIESAAPLNGEALLYNSATNQWEHAPITFSGGPPTGPAGGSLAGLYPNPSLSTVGTAGTYGSATQVPVLTTTAEGRVSGVTLTTISGVLPGGAASGDLSGNYPGPTVAGLQGRPVASSAPVATNVLAWSGTAWVPTSVDALVSGAQSVYGAFSDAFDQQIPVGSAISVQYHTTEASNGITVTNDGLGNPTRLTVSTAGVYAFDISPQLFHSGGTGSVVYFWAAINGTVVPRSGSSLEMGNNNNRTLPFLSVIFSMAAGQYLEWFFTATGTDTGLKHFDAAGILPEIPSVIANVRRLGA